MKIILFTVDQSFSVSVAALTGKLASAVNGKVTLVYITSIDEEKAAGDFILDQASKLMDGVKIEKKHQRGSSLAEIMDLLDAEEYDLAVFEERRRRGIFPTEQDSLVQKVIKHSQIPILLLRQKSNKFNKMLICTGGTEISEPVINMGAKLASKMEIETTLLHVEGSVPVLYNIAGVKDEPLKNIIEEETPLAKHLKKCDEIFGDNKIKCDAMIKHGVVDETIIETAHNGHYDLVILGASWSRKKLTGFIMGDTTKELIKRMNSAILIVKSKS